MDRVKINVSGTWFEFDKSILKDCKSLKLSNLCRENLKVNQALELTVDRSAACFGAVLDYCQTGDLHLPLLVCPGSFQRELDFWEVDLDELQECCLYRYQSFLDDELLRKNFLRQSIHPTVVVTPEVVTSGGGVVQSCRTKLWNVIDNNETSFAAKVYFYVMSLLVALAICAMALSTVPSLRRSVSKCELLDYLDQKHHKDYKKIAEILGSPDCSNMGAIFSGVSWDESSLYEDDYNWVYYMYSWDWQTDVGMQNVGSLTDQPIGNLDQPKGNTDQPIGNLDQPKGNTDQPKGNPDAPSGTVDQQDVNLDPNSPGQTTVTNNGTTESSIVELTTPNFDEISLPWVTEVPQKIEIQLPKLTVPKPFFMITDFIINACFTVDFLLRVTSCPSLKIYFTSVINIFDALALFSTYIQVIIVYYNREYYYVKTSGIMLLEFAQVFRTLRLFRVVKNVRASQVLGYSITRGIKDMALLATLLFVGISTFAYLFYIAETWKGVVSVPHAWYWAVVTMTTVGYGDISPQTDLGRAVAAICAICGVLLLSVTLPMFVNNFLTLYHFSCVNDSFEKRKREKMSKTNENGNDVTAVTEIRTRKTSESVDRPAVYESPDKPAAHMTQWYHAEDI